MDTIVLCGWSAFQFYRTPPIVRHLESLLIEDDEAPLEASGRFLGGISYPLHVLADNDADRPRSASFVPHVRTGLPSSAINPVIDGVLVTTPLYTLLTLATQLSPVRLALAASEMAGGFAIFKPNIYQQSVLDALDRGELPDPALADLAHDLRHNPWRQSRDLAGKPASLWQRPPLITRDEVSAFLPSAFGHHGCSSLRKAAGLIVENAASPFEVQAAVLLGKTQRQGGAGLGEAACNARIELRDTARQVAGQQHCYCDLLFRGKRDALLDIECHSRRWHNRPDKAISDANRATALRCIGIEVVHLTYRQLQNAERIDEISRMARTYLGIRQRPPSVATILKKETLRKEVLTDWDTFGQKQTE